MRNANGRAALRCWPIQINLAGETFIIPGLPAIKWILKIADEDWLGIIPGLVQGDEIDDILENSVSRNIVVSAARDAVSIATGMPWWSACRLTKLAVEDVEFAGALIIAGIDTDHVSIGGFCAACYRLLVGEQDKKQRSKIDFDLGKIPPGITTGEVYDPVQAGNQFERMFSGQPKG